MYLQYLKTFIVFIKISYIYLYSYIVNYVLFNNFEQHYIYCIDKFTRENMLFIKFLQWCPPNNSSDIINNKIRKYGDNVPYTSEDINLSVFDEIHNTCKKQNKQISINKTPIKSGTLALVYEGEINDKPVIIKVLRKNILNKLIESINTIKFIGFICSNIYFLNFLNLYDVIKLQEQSLLDQANFKIEIDNMKKFKNAFKKSNYIIIPEVYDELTKNNDDVIIMERINGRTAEELKEEELDNYTVPYDNLWFESILDNGMLHGDLHIGNLFFLENYKIGLIDFGYVNYFDKDILKNTGLFYKFLLNKQAKKLTKLLLNSLIEYDNSGVNKKYEDDEIFNIVYKELKESLLINGGLSGKLIQIEDIVHINNCLKIINGKLKQIYVNMVLSIGPANSVAKIIKHVNANSDFGNNFSSFILSKAPKSLQNYD